MSENTHNEEEYDNYDTECGSGAVASSTNDNGKTVEKNMSDSDTQDEELDNYDTDGVKK